ncbi:MAG: hypothetical protein ACK559_31745, partial [bacterium]
MPGLARAMPGDQEIAMGAVEPRPAGGKAHRARPSADSPPCSRASARIASSRAAASARSSASSSACSRSISASSAELRCSPARRIERTRPRERSSCSASAGVGEARYASSASAMFRRRRIALGR